jgi:hypothetical protein
MPMHHATVPCGMVTSDLFTQFPPAVGTYLLSQAFNIRLASTVTLQLAFLDYG